MQLTSDNLWAMAEAAFHPQSFLFGLERPALSYVKADGVALFELNGPTAKRSFFGTSTDEAARLLGQISDDPDVGAVVLKIYSPGGQVSGQKQFADAVAQLNSQKPVLAYIDSLGASAAYWTASQASLIYSDSMANVGSIGTYGVITDYSGAAEEAGVKVHVIRAGELKGMGVPGDEVTAEQLAYLQAKIDEMNEFFLSAVSDGRGLPMDRVRTLATGETWIGAKAEAVGLTDGVRSFDEVLAEARSLAGETQTGRSAPMAATIQELKAACPGAPSDFLMEQLEAEADAETAKGNYIALLQLQAEESAKAKAESDKARAEAEAEAKKAAEAAKVGVESQIKAGGSDEDDQGGTAAERFEAAVSELTRRGIPRHKAVAKVCRENPELQEAYVEDHNAQHQPASVQIRNQRRGRKEVTQ